MVSSYLQGGLQTTKIGQNISKKVEITCGVPQEPFYVQYYFFFTIMIITANEKLCNLYDWLC